MKEKNKLILRHFVRFFYPGILVSDATDEEVVGQIIMPESAFGCMTYDKIETVIGGEKLVGAPKNYSARTFIGKKYNLIQVKKEFPNEKILIENMIDNKFKYVVHTKFGQFFPIENKDKVIER